jgi:hypothetical protein
MDDVSKVTRNSPELRREAMKLSTTVTRARQYAEAAIAGAVVTVEQLTEDKHTARKVLARAAFDQLADATSTKAALRYVTIVAGIDERDHGPDAA